MVLQGVLNGVTQGVLNGVVNGGAPSPSTFGTAVGFSGSNYFKNDTFSVGLTTQYTTHFGFYLNEGYNLTIGGRTLLNIGSSSGLNVIVFRTTGGSTTGNYNLIATGVSDVSASGGGITPTWNITSSTSLARNTWYSCYFAVDTGAGTAQFRINGIDQGTVTINDTGDLNVDGPIAVGGIADVAGPLTYNPSWGGRIYNLWQEFVYLPASGYVANFYNTSNGRFKQLNNDGSGSLYPSQPASYFRDGAASFVTERGITGATNNLTNISTVVDATGPQLDV